MKRDATPPRDAPAKRARLRDRWRSASLKTSFMGYTLGFLLLALVLATGTSMLFAQMQNVVTWDAHELSGLYLYDKDANALVSARSVDVDEDGSSAFVQTMRGDASILPLDEIPRQASITDTSDYRYSDLAANLESGFMTGLEEPGMFVIEGADPGKLTVEDLPAYDAQAREQFQIWASEHPDSPYAALFAGDDEGSTGLLVSAVGYYLSTPPSDGAFFLSNLLGALTFLMFPLWFGLCIFAAARRFFRKRLAPGFAVLDDAAASIARQDLDFAVSYDRDDELGRLAASFETMRASLAESQRTLWRTAEERKRLNAAFAHDLRTPLTILKGKVELLDARLRTGGSSPDQLAASVSSLAEQVQRLERYVEAMTGLQKLEDRAAVVGETGVDEVASMIEDIGRALAAQSGTDVSFSLSVNPRCERAQPPLRVDQSMLGEVAENLIANAVRYATARVDAHLDVRDGTLVLAVEDDGPGFTPEALERGCAPFFSEAPSREHFGLGLNIASLLCEKHGGSLTLENHTEAKAVGSPAGPGADGARPAHARVSAGTASADAGTANAGAGTTDAATVDAGMEAAATTDAETGSTAGRGASASADTMFDTHEGTMFAANSRRPPTWPSDAIPKAHEGATSSATTGARTVARFSLEIGDVDRR